MRVICFLLLFIIVQLTIAQKSDFTKFNPDIHLRIYRIEISNYQFIELVETNDHAFKGRLINRVRKINRKEKHKKIISETLMIPSSDVKQIMGIANRNEIETLPNSLEIKKYTNGLDGMNMSFVIEKSNSTRSFSYWEPESNYQDSTLMEVIAVRNIISTLREKINFEFHFEKFRSNLPIGKYAYGGVIVTIR